MRFSRSHTKVVILPQWLEVMQPHSSVEWGSHPTEEHSASSRQRPRSWRCVILLQTHSYSSQHKFGSSWLSLYVTRTTCSKVRLHFLCSNSLSVSHAPRSLHISLNRKHESVSFDIFSSVQASFDLHPRLSYTSKDAPRLITLPSWKQTSHTHVQLGQQSPTFLWSSSL